MALVLLLAGCASRSPSPPPQPAHLEHEEYVIGVRDTVRIIVWKNPELSTDTVVDSDGKISLPLIDDVQAAGLTPMELKQVLKREFSEHVTDPQVTVIVTSDNPFCEETTTPGPLLEYRRRLCPQLPDLDRG